MNWINCEDRLPQDGELVLIYDERNAKINIATYNSKFSNTIPWINSGNWWGKELIHYWLPIPKVPKVMKE